MSGGAATFAPNFAVETTPIENWLEIEDGVSPFFTREFHGMGYQPDLYEAMDFVTQAEFMLGVGLQWVYLR